MNIFAALKFYLISLFLITNGFCSLASIGGQVANEVPLSDKAKSTLKSLLAERPGRTAGNVCPTGSMAPTLDETYIVVVDKTSFAELKRGQIAIFHVSWTKNIIAHRLVGHLPWGWKTKGDACSNEDPSELTEGNFTGYTVVAAIKKSTGETKYLN